MNLPARLEWLSQHTNPEKPQLAEVWREGDYLIASQGVYLIAVGLTPKERNACEVLGTDTHPNAAPFLVPLDGGTVIRLGRLLAWCGKPTPRLYGPCTACDGKGGHPDEAEDAGWCEQCEGHGEGWPVIAAQPALVGKTLVDRQLLGWALSPFADTPGQLVTLKTARPGDPVYVAHGAAWRVVLSPLDQNSRTLLNLSAVDFEVAA